MARKTALMLLPGLLCDRALWRGQIEALRDVADIYVADLTRDDSVPAMVRRLLDDAPPHFALAGLSMGGYCAFEVMRQAPDRVERLALLDTGARADTPEQTSRRRGLIELAACEFVDGALHAGHRHRRVRGEDVGKPVDFFVE